MLTLLSMSNAFKGRGLFIIIFLSRFAVAYSEERLINEDGLHYFIYIQMLYPEVELLVYFLV